MLFSHPLSELFIKSKIQFSESKSQRVAKGLDEYKVVYQVKDTIFWKQITTELWTLQTCLTLFIKSKIQFSESKSQQRTRFDKHSDRCLSSQRYNFLKANHNGSGMLENLPVVVYQVKDTIFWKQITTIPCRTMFDF